MGYAVNKTPHPWSHKSKAKERQRVRWRSDSKGLLFCDIRNVVGVCVQDVNCSFLLPRRIYKKASEDTVHVVVGSLQFQFTTKK